MFLKELLRFSKENWWVYLMLAIILGIISYTGRGNLVEIILLFLVNFLANIFVMVAISNYSKQNNTIGAVYHFCSSFTFLLLGAYGAFVYNDFQYFIFQVSFMIAAIKAITFYKFKKDLKWVSEWFMLFLNITLFGVFIYYFPPNFSGILLGVGFSIVTLGLVSTKDTFRYFMNMLGSIFIVGASAIMVYSSFIEGSVDGIGLGFLLLTLTALLYFMKLLPSYIIKLKK